MARDARATPALVPEFEPQDGPERLSQSGRMVGWAVYGGLLLVGFFFGIVTGYERPKTVVVAKAPKEKKPKGEKPEKGEKGGDKKEKKAES